MRDKMSDYISREAFLDAIERGKKYQQDADDIAEMLQNFPAADVRPVVRGKWKYRGQKVIDDLFPTYACSVCHGVIPADWRRKCNFCNNCGADMRPEPPKEET